MNDGQSGKTTTEAASSRRRIEAEDLYRIRLLSDPQISPDGRLAAYVQTRLRTKQNDYGSNVWLVPADGTGEPRRFTTSNRRDTTPRWSPDGSQLAFISTRSGRPQLWVIPLNGGEARQLTHLKNGAGEYAWSPDGEWLAVASAVDMDGAAATGKVNDEEGEQTDADSENREPGLAAQSDLGGPLHRAEVWDEDEEDETGDEDKGDHVREITRFHYKADGKGMLERREHLFLVSARAGRPEPRQITSGDWDAGAPRWSPDARSIAFLANQAPDADYHNIQDIFVLPVSDDGHPGEQRQVTGHNAAIESFDWLPSGDGFAVFAHRRVDEGAAATNTEVWALSLEGAVRNLTEAFDRPVGFFVTNDLRSGAGELRPYFDAEGRFIYFPVTSEGNIGVYTVPLLGGEVTCLVGGDRTVLALSVAGDRILYLASSPILPNDLFSSQLDGSGEVRLTDVNQDLMSTVELAEPRSFRVDRPGGVRVQGWTIEPSGAERGTDRPLVLEIHGGPHMSYGNAYFHEFQALAARGYKVLYTNPRGSQGYGQAFADAILNDWGGVDYQDIIACLDHVVAQGGVDESRLGVGGGSYGGFMVTWVIGHTDRFKVAVASRMVSNVYSAWGSGDGTWMLWSWEYGGMPQERTEFYMERSPITYAREIRTPLLITHAEDDHRTSIEQGEQMYMALKYLKRDVKMLRLPAGGHDISRSGKPSLRVERLQAILDWFDRYLQPGTE